MFCCCEMHSSLCSLHVYFSRQDFKDRSQKSVTHIHCSTFCRLHTAFKCTSAQTVGIIKLCRCSNDSQFGWWNMLHSNCDCTQDSSTDSGHEAVAPVVPGGQGLAAQNHLPCRSHQQRQDLSSPQGRLQLLLLLLLLMLVLFLLWY